MVEVAEANIAKDFKIGNTRIKIATDFCKDKTPEDVQKILDRIARAVMPSLIAAEAIKHNEKIKQNT